MTFEEWYNKFPKLDIEDLEKVRYIKYKSIWEEAYRVGYEIGYNDGRKAGLE